MEDLTLIQTGTWIDGLDQDGAPDSGEKILYTFELTNTGTVDLTNVAITGLGIAINPGSFNGNLATGETVTLTGEYIIQQTDIDNAQVAIAATATGQGTIPITVQAQTNPVPLDQFTSLNIIKTPTGFRDANGSGRRDAGDEAIYSYRVINTGNVTLRNVSLGDDNGVPGTNPLIAVPLVGLVDGDADGQANDLRPGGEATGELRTIITQEFLTAGIVENIATAKAQSPQGINELVSTAAQIDVRDPKIDVTKRVETVADTNNNGVRDAGDLVTYSYSVNNIGNVPLLNIKLRDNNGTAAVGDDFDVTPLVGLVDADNDGFVDDLAVGAIATGTEVIPLTQAAVNAGSLTNIVNAEGTSPSVTFKDVVRPGRTVKDNANATVTIASTPKIAIVKTAGAIADTNQNGFIGDAGDTVVYSYSVTNTGNVSLLDVTLEDDNGTSTDKTDDFFITLGGQISNLNGNTIPDLEVGKVATGQSAPIALTAADIILGQVTNIAQARATDPKGKPVDGTARATVVVPTKPNPPLIGLVKTAGEIQDNDCDGNPSAGDTVIYTYAVSNIGPVDLFNLKLMDDNGTPDILGDGFEIEILGLADLDRDGQFDDLAVGQTASGYYTKTITPEDISKSFFTNIGSVEGFSITKEKATATDPETIYFGRPQIQLEKCAELDLGDDCVANAGDLVKYYFHVTNTGNVALNPIVIIDPLLGNSPIAFANGITSLAPGECVDAVASYQITQADLDNGKIHNFATAYGNPPNGNPKDFSDDVKATAEADICLPQNAVIAIDKVTVYGDQRGEYIKIPVGSAIVWEYTITNQGNVSLSNIALSDQLTGAVSTANIISRSFNDDNVLNVGETWVYRVNGTAIEGNYCSDGVVTGAYKDCDNNQQSTSATDWNDYIGYSPKPTPSHKRNRRDSWTENGSGSKNRRWEDRSDTFGDRRTWSVGSEKANQVLV
jgi:large repetitive protein